MDYECRIVKFQLNRFTSIWYCRTHDTKLHNAYEIGRHVTCPDLINLSIEPIDLTDLIKDIPAEEPKKEKEESEFNFTYFYDDETNELFVEFEEYSDNNNYFEETEIEIDDLKEALEPTAFKNFCAEVVKNNIDNYINGDINTEKLREALICLQELIIYIEEES